MSSMLLPALTSGLAGNRGLRSSQGKGGRKMRPQRYARRARRFDRRAILTAAVRPLEGLEDRRLLSGTAPVAVGDALTTLEDQPLTLTPGVTSLYFNSQAGDYIGQGKTQT